jgi:sugar lactone lactonase YvrE
MRRLLVVLAVVLAATSLVTAVAVAGPKKPDRIELPNGFQPEGIASGRGSEVFVGSIPTGRVLALDTKTGKRREVVPARSGHAAIGLKHDAAKRRLFVSGGPTGKAFAYNARTGAERSAFQLTPAGQPAFINDVVLTRRVAYFTDSSQPVVYAVKRNLSGVRPIELSGFPMVAGEINLNGIEAAPSGKLLLAVQTATGALWRIKPSTGGFSQVDLHGASLTNGDGLLLLGKRTLLAVQNMANRIAVVKLSRDYRSGRVVRTIANPGFDVPTTVAKKRGSLYLPNARFTTPATPATPYWVTRVPLR